jgi:hypothetical protein
MGLLSQFGLNRVPLLVPHYLEGIVHFLPLSSAYSIIHS